MNLKKFKIRNLKKKYDMLPVSVKAALWFMICNVLQRGISVLTVPIFTRLLTTEQYGQYTLFQSWLAIFTLICTFRLNYSVFTKGMSKFPNERDEFTVSIQTTMTIITTIVFLIYLFFHNKIDSFTDMNFIMTLAMFLEIYFATSIQIWSLRHRYEFNYRVIILPTVLLSLAVPIAGILAVKMTIDKGMARIISSVVVQVIFGIYFYMLIIKKGKKLLNFRHMKFAITFNIPLIPHYLSTYVLEQVDRIMIQKMCSYSEAAIYSVAYNAGTLMKIVTDAINNSIVPWIYQKLEQKAYKDIEKYVISVLIVIVLVCIVFMSFAPEMVRILGGKEYISSVYVIPPVAASMFFTFFFSIISNIEFFYDANKFTMYISMIGAVLNIILNYIFIDKFGYIAAGYTTLVCYTFFAIAHYLFMTVMVKRKVGIVLIHPKKVIVLSVALILLTIGMNSLYKYSFIRYGLLLILFILIISMKDKIIFVLMKK